MRAPIIVLPVVILACQKPPSQEELAPAMTRLAAELPERSAPRPRPTLMKRLRELALGPAFSTYLRGEKLQQAFDEAPTLAVVELSHTIEECSGAGGSHASLEVVDVIRGSEDVIGKRVHFGAHAYYGFLGYPGFKSTDQTGRYFVAPLGDIAKAKPTPIGSVGWCLDQLGTVHGSTNALLPVASATLGRQAAYRIEAGNAVTFQPPGAN
jgi:hypothetical protein